jgi:hypothetical protein
VHRLEVAINAGIGDIILSHAMLSSSGCDYVVGLSHHAVNDNRSEGYASFAKSLALLLFGENRVDWSIDGYGVNPLELWSEAIPAASPDLRDVLPAGVELPIDNYVVVTTKVRGWQRGVYEKIKHRLIEAVGKVAKTKTIVLVGERDIGMNAEYRHHGKEMVYSIHEDLADIESIDLTVPELGITPPDFDKFRHDCLVMKNAIAVVTVGSGGNVSMALACGNCIALTEGTEMGRLFCRLPADPRHRLCRSADEYFEAVEALA